MRIHHIGLVVDRIEDRLSRFTDDLGLAQISDVVIDPAQESRLVLLADDSGAVRIELIEPTSETSPVASSAAKGGGLAHVCYEAADLDAEIARLVDRGALLVREPLPAVLFDGRRVAFLFLRGHGVIELLEAGS